MKKKAIRDIPYGLPEYRDGKRYFARAKRLKIGDEDHLILDIWDRDKSQEMPLVRTAVTKKDYGNWWPLESRWTRKNIYTWWMYTIWSPDRASKEHTWISEESVRSIDDFCGAGSGSWIIKLSSRISDISTAESQERIRKRGDDFRQRCRELPEVPGSFIEWAEDLLPNAYIFYKRKGSWATCRCSECGSMYAIRIKPKSGEKDYKPPVSGVRDKCLECGYVGEFKPIGRARPTYTIFVNAWLVQPFREKGAVARSFLITKILSTAGKKRVLIDETARFFSLPAGDRTDYLSMDGEGWKPAKRMQWGVICTKGILFKGNLDQLKGTDFEYSQLETWADGEAPVPAYMRAYRTMPYLEIFVKLGLDRLTGIAINRGAREMQDRYGISWPARSPAALLGIDKEDIPMLAEKFGTTALLRILQCKHKTGGRWTEDQIRALREMEPDTDTLAEVLEHSGVQKFINKIKGYVNKKSYRTADVSHACREYLDYFRMARDVGYDMSSSITLYPKDLLAMHDRMVEETNVRKQEARMKTVNDKYRDIPKRFRELRAKYGYSQGGLMIRPARDAAEIVQEGCRLHHCVGGDSYLSKHNEGRSAIMFIRRRNDPNTPYITVEIDGERLIQWYGIRDTKPDREEIDAWIAEWMDAVKKRMSRKIAPAQMEREAM